MSDAATRAKERATDDPQAEVAVLAARLRDGSLTRDRLELAAYCGHAGAREALGVYPCGCPLGTDNLSACLGTPLAPLANLDAWLRGLGRWPGALLRAAVAAAWAVHACGFGCMGGSAEHRAIEAAEAWLADPSELRLGAAHEACAGIGANWCYFAPLLPPPCGLDATFGATPGPILSAAGEAGEQPVREAVCAALIEWALR